jgi:hypothetical protein
MDMVDVEAAFLNALVDTDVYMELPEGSREYMRMQGIKLDNDTVIKKLLRAQYGLVQSPRLWMETFSLILTSLGLKQCKTDPCLFCLFVGILRRLHHRRALKVGHSNQDRNFWTSESI